MTKARSNATAEAAKGDLRVGNGTNLSGILAVGNNGETIVADSSTATGLRWQVPVNSNPVLNSSFQIWQRGTSTTWVSTNSQYYAADRWQAFSATTDRTVTRQVTGDTTNLPNIQYCARVQRTSGNTNTSAIYLTQNFETVNSIAYAGKTVTLSFYARKGANYSPTSSLLNALLITGTGTDENVIYPGYTGNTQAINQSATLTTTWQRFQYTGTIATTATELCVQFGANVTGTAGAADYYEITGVQLEVGSVATPFKTYAGTIQGELAACQRYYQLIASGNNKILGLGSYITSAVIDGPIINFPVEMRTTPTISIVSGTNYFLAASAGANPDVLNSLTLATESTPRTAFFYNSTEAAGTAGQVCRLQTNNAAAFLAVQAEL